MRVVVVGYLVKGGVSVRVGGVVGGRELHKRSGQTVYLSVRLGV